MKNTKNTKNTKLGFDTIEELKSFEMVDPKVSDKYVPIFSSELVELLTPEFEFTGGSLVAKSGSKNRSAHYFDLEVKEEKTRLRIFNSYDRSMALSVSMVSDGIYIPLGVTRLVHIGEKAKSFVTDFTEVKQEIKEAAGNAKKIEFFLTDTKIPMKIAKEISKCIVFASPNILEKDVQEIVNFNELLVGEITIADYIKKSINSFMKGDFIVTRNNKKINMRERKNITLKLKVNSLVMKLLTEEYPEVFL